MGGDVDQAEEYHIRALQGREANFGAAHPETLASATCLALLHLRQDRLYEAEALYRRAIHRHEEGLVGKHPETLERIGQLYKLLQRKLCAIAVILLRQRMLLRKRIAQPRKTTSLTAHLPQKALQLQAWSALLRNCCPPVRPKAGSLCSPKETTSPRSQMPLCCNQMSRA